jgi:hypothetical protein
MRSGAAITRRSRGERPAPEWQDATDVRTGGAADVGSRALKSGRKIGSDAVSRIASETRHRPLFVILVAVGVGVLIGMAGRRR